MASASAGPAANPNAGAPAGGGAEIDTSAAAERAVNEADIVNTDGGRLYALSRTRGLSIVDISSSSRLALLGEALVPGVPFEMYRRGDVILVMSNNAISYDGLERSAANDPKVPSDRSTTSGAPPSPSTSSARVTVLDVRDPAQIRRLGFFNVPGGVVDSRLVGDVLYVVSQEGAQCYACTNQDHTVVTSFDVRVAHEAKRVDQIRFLNDNFGGVAVPRSVIASATRMYVGGIDSAWIDRGSAQSSIQAIDISDSTGHIRLGTKIAVRGQIMSRWQMDEYQGVLRVISQRDIAVTTNGSGQPFVDTFRVTSADAISPLGQTTLRLPIQEALKSVRFDGPRAYAITFRETDPLYTIDLSTPSAPVQKGELEMPGYVHHIEPRGSRLLALGFDRTDGRGGLNVSLFDVSSLASPKMLARVAFGGNYGAGEFAEDQNRIHKSFGIFDDEGLIAIPFTLRFESQYGQTTCTSSESGIQLVDWRLDMLQKRGLASLPGNPRRALLHEGRLLGVSDTAVRSYSIVDRDQVAVTAELATGQCSIPPAGQQPYDVHGSYGYGSMCE